MRTRRFHEKTWVWVPDADKGYVSSWVMKEDAHIAECMGIDDKIRVVSKEDYSRQNPPKASGAAGISLQVNLPCSLHKWKTWPSSLTSTRLPSCITWKPASSTIAFMSVWALGLLAR
jgi:hypothetical protein